MNLLLHVYMLRIRRYLFSFNSRSTWPLHTAAFMDTIIHPPSSIHISLLDTIKLHGGAVDFDELVVCYYRQRNLGDILSPRKLRMGDNLSIADFFAHHF